MKGMALKNPYRFVERVRTEKKKYTFGVRDKQYRLLDFREGTPRIEFYDLKADPLEQKNLADLLRVPDGMKKALQEYIHQSETFQPSFVTEAVPTELRRNPEARKAFIEQHSEQKLSDEDKERLKALGYLD